MNVTGLSLDGDVGRSPRSGPLGDGEVVVKESSCSVGDLPASDCRVLGTVGGYDIRLEGPLCRLAKMLPRTLAYWMLEEEVRTQGFVNSKKEIPN